MSIVIERTCTDAVYNIYNFVEDKALCDHNRGRTSIESKVSLPTSNIIAAYLLLTFTKGVHTDIMKWKMSINDVILTREFKPHIEKSISDEYVQSAFVYDITKILTGNEVSFRISCNAKGYMYLDGASLLTVMHYKDFNTHIFCQVNPYAMNNVETLSFNVSSPLEINESAIHLGLVANHTKPLKVEVDNNIVRKVNVSKGYNVIEIAVSRNRINTVKVDSGDTKLRHLFSCLELRQARYPKIVVEGLSISNHAIGLSLKNVGDGASDSLELVVLRYGIPVYRTVLPVLKPGELLTHEVALDSISRSASFKANSITLRIIWTKAYKLFEQDVPIKISSAT